MYKPTHHKQKYTAAKSEHEDKVCLNNTAVFQTTGKITYSNIANLSITYIFEHLKGLTANEC